MIKNIIFDLGNVLLDQKDISADAYFASILGIPNDASKEFYKAYKRGTVSGTLSFTELIHLYKKNFTCTLSKEEILKKYKQLYINDVKGVNKELVDIIKQLRARYSIYLMTNTLPPHFDHWKTLGFDHYFKMIFRSDEDRFFKPETQSYTYVVNKIGAKPEECIFIDNLLTNIEGAQRAGLKGILYTNNKSLLKDLLKFGINI